MTCVNCGYRLVERDPASSGRTMRLCDNCQTVMCFDDTEAAPVRTRLALDSARTPDYVLFGTTRNSTQKVWQHARFIASCDCHDGQTCVRACATTHHIECPSLQTVIEEPRTR